MPFTNTANPVTINRFGNTSYNPDPFSRTILMNSTKYRIGFNNVKLCAYFGILSIGVNKPLINMKITIKNHAINIACCWVSV